MKSSIMSAYNTDEKLSRKELAAIPVPPARGPRHNPIPFGEFVDEVELQLDKVGLQVIDQEHMVGHEAMRYFGLMEVAPKEGQLITSDEWKVLVGLSGSHDQVIGRKIAMGKHVMLCSNLCFGGDIYTSSTKQTLNIWNRLPGMIYNGVRRIPQMADLEEKRIQKFKDIHLSNPNAMYFLNSLFRQGSLTSSQLGRAIHEWYEPTYEFTAPDEDPTVWRLENAITEVIKPAGERSANMFTVMERTQQISDYLTETFID